jgi:hypothetical protein
MKKIWNIHTIEHYAAMKNNEIMLFAGKWVELEIIMLRETRRTKRDK